MPLNIDGFTMSNDYGHFARVLMIIDFTSHLPNSLTLEGDTFSTKV